MPLPLHVEPTTYFFRNPEGNPITTQWWPRKSWYPVLRILNIRPRKFYATRHTFITVAVSKPGINLKWLADYCGTSVEMIEDHYAGSLHHAAQVAQLELLSGDRDERADRAEGVA